MQADLAAVWKDFLLSVRRLLDHLRDLVVLDVVHVVRPADRARLALQLRGALPAHAMHTGAAKVAFAVAVAEVGVKVFADRARRRRRADAHRAGATGRL